MIASLSRFFGRSASPQRVLLGSFVVVTAFKLLVALLFPLTGDEAYFIQWGRSLDGSYYDHGPITGWWIWLHLLAGDNLALIRLPAVAITLVVGYILWRILRPLDEEKAAWAATLFVWSPFSILSVLMTTDIPLAYFSMLAVAMAVRAHRTQRPLDYVLAGMLLGLAFLSKYFAVLIGFALAVWWLAFSGRPRPAAVLWLLAGVLPFAAQHLYWNYHHSWVNVVFNVLNRQEPHGLTWAGPVLFLVMATYLLGPVTVAAGRALWRGEVAGRTIWAQLRTTRAGLLVAMIVVPYTVLFLVSFTHPIGVHWLLAFYPFAFAGAVVLFRRPQLAQLVRPMMIFGGIHGFLALVVALLPLELARSQRSYGSIVLGAYPRDVTAALAPYLPEFQLATPSYAKSALLDFYIPGAVPVLGRGSFHGRQDDLRTDLRTYDGTNLMILTDRRHQAEESLTWFRQAEVQHLEVRGAKLILVLGRGFDYQRYRERVLTRIAADYYRMPAWLSRYSAGCFFRQRYDLPPAEVATPN